MMNRSRDYTWLPSCRKIRISSRKHLQLHLPIVACASSDGSGSPSLGIPMMNLAPARVTYRFNGQQVAVREGVTLTFVYGDHLGGASLTADASGAKVSEMRYYPYGEVRFSSGNLPSDRTFTGQRAENVGAVGSLMDYGARFYAPTLGRFISPDTIVPKPSDPQSINRYTYVLNRPLTGNDPDGHCFPVCTALIGAAIGAIVGSGSYMIAMAVSGQEIRADHALLAAGAGALAGGLIGTGIGIAAMAPVGTAAAAATTLGATLVGGGIGAGAAGEGYILSRPIEQWGGTQANLSHQNSQRMSPQVWLMA
jgi:RHS repeat-associated protein